MGGELDRVAQRLPGVRDDLHVLPLLVRQRRAGQYLQLGALVGGLRAEIGAPHRQADPLRAPLQLRARGRGRRHAHLGVGAARLQRQVEFAAPAGPTPIA